MTVRLQVRSEFARSSRRAVAGVADNVLGVASFGGRRAAGGTFDVVA